MIDFKHEIEKLLKKEVSEVELSTPPNPAMGDYTFPCFKLAIERKKAPNAIAEELAKKIAPNEYVKEIKAAGPFLNFFVNKEKMSHALLNEIFHDKERYGYKKMQNKTVLIEYFQANTHKGVHIGHIRNICLGESLCRIFEADGFKVIRSNYQGDIGPHVAKCIWGYSNLHSGKEPKENKGVWLGKVYAEASKKADEDPAVEEEIREMTKKLYDGDKKLTEVWKKTRQWCLDDFEEFYKEFNVKFDRIFFESETEAPGKKIVQQMVDDRIAYEDEGAIIVNLDEYELGKFLLLRNDGVGLYSTKDLGLQSIKLKEFKKIDRSIHVVGSEQYLYFKQLFKTFELIKSPMAGISHHLSYGLVMLPEGKMSSREGTMVLYEDLIGKLRESTMKGVEERHKDWDSSDKDKSAEQIAFGALKFAMVNRENNKNITFEWEKALAFEGETGPYVQYAHARICSILRKYDQKVTDKVDFGRLSHDKEKQIVAMLEKFKGLIGEAAEGYKPHIIVRYALDLAQLFSEFYRDCQVISEDENLTKARILLAECTRQVLANCLYLLNIPAPERM